MVEDGRCSGGARFPLVRPFIPVMNARDFLALLCKLTFIAPTAIIRRHATKKTCIRGLINWFCYQQQR